MIRVREVRRGLPILEGSYMLRELREEDIEVYLNNLRAIYYNRYQDYKFSEKREVDIRRILEKKIRDFREEKRTTDEGRLVLEDRRTGDIVGGCTLIEIEGENKLELAYFVRPKYQHRGLGKLILKIIVKHIDAEEYILTIREDNKSSVGVAKGVGFTERTRYVGKYGVNVVYTKEKER